MSDEQYAFPTRAIRAGQEFDPTTGAVVPPIYMTSTFVQDGKEHSANFTTSGAWVETEQRIKEKDLPEVVRAAVLTQYPGATVHKAERVSTPEHDLFEVELKTSSGKVEVMVTAEGAIVEDPRK